MHTILYIDDEHSLLELGKGFLEKQREYTVLTLESATEALRYLESHRVSAIISDYQMPGMDGISFLKELRARGDATPFIIFTGRGREEVVIEALNAGAIFYIQKRGDPKTQFQELMHKVRLAIAKRSGIDALKQREEQYRLMNDAMTDLTFIQDREGRFTIVSKSTCEVTGLQLEDIIGKTCRELGLSPEFCREWDDCCREVLTSNRAASLRATIHSTAGETRTYEGTMHPLHDNAGNVTGVAGSCRDITWHTKVEEELRQSKAILEITNAQLNEAQRIVGIGSWTFNMATGHPEWSREMFTIFGLDPSKGVPSYAEFRDLVAPEQRPDLDRVVERATNEGRGYSLELKVRRPDGEDRTVRQECEMVRLEGSTLPFILGTSQDITERKRQENALKESEERYRNVVEDQTEFICRFLPDGTHIFVNEAYCRYFGLTREEIIGQVFTPVLPGEDRGLLTQHFRSLTPDHPIASISHRIILPDGSVRWQRWSDRAIFRSNGDVVEYQSVGRDISEQMEIGEALRNSELLLRGIIDHLPDPTLVINVEGDVIAWNRAIEGLTNVRAGDMLGKGNYEYAIPFYGERRPLLADLVLRKDDRIKDLYEKIQQEGETLITETSYARPQGRSAVLWAKASPLYDKQGRMIGAIESIRDITGRKQVEEQFRRVNRQLNLLSSITRHDILNQVQILKGYLDISSQGSLSPDQQARYIEKERNAASTIEEQIAFTREYQDMGERPPEWHDLAAVIQRTAAARLPGDTRVQTDNVDWEVFADPLFEKVIYNLIDNAARHGGSMMTIISFSSHESEGDLVIVCEDNGIGIPLHDKNCLFNQGFGKNTGLGLFLAHEILAITHMKIRETGDPGEGARFEITVPTGMWRKKTP